MELQEIAEPKPSFLDVAKQGNSSGWRYVVGISSILFFWLIIGGIATAVLLIIFGIIQGISLVDLPQLITDPILLGYIRYYLVLNIGFLFF